MAASPFSVRLDDEIKARLESEAQRQDRSAGYIAQKAIEGYLNSKDSFRREMEALIAEADKGVFVSEEAMNRWMESWDTENELPPPEPDIFPDKN
jgi:predicted transcriptional regulator